MRKYIYTSLLGSFIVSSGFGQTVSYTVCTEPEPIVKSMGYSVLTLQRCLQTSELDTQGFAYYEFFGTGRAGSDVESSRFDLKEAKDLAIALSKLISVTESEPKTPNEFYTLTNQTVSFYVKANKSNKWEYYIDYNIKSVRRTNTPLSRKELEHLRDYFAKEK